MKYIVDIPSELVLKDDGYSFSDGNSYCITGNLSKLTPYTEYDRKAIEDEVWEFATICTKMDGADSVDVFGGFSLDSFTKFSYQEAKNKYEEWLKQKDEIKVGDEVIIPDDINYDKMIITRLWKTTYDYDAVDTIGYDGRICSFLKSKVKKTGRHFNEVEELLKKIGSEE